MSPRAFSILIELLFWGAIILFFGIRIYKYYLRRNEFRKHKAEKEARDAAEEEAARKAEEEGKMI